MTVMFDTISSDLQLTVPKAVMWSVWCSGCYLMECKSVWFKKSKVTSGFQKTDSSGSLSAKEWRNLRGADWWWESRKFYFPVKSHLRCFKSTVMKRQKRSKVWPLKWCSCIGLIGSLSRLLSFHENMTKDVVWFSPPFKNSATQEQMSCCYLKNICILFCFTQWTSGQAESSSRADVGNTGVTGLGGEEVGLSEACLRGSRGGWGCALCCQGLVGVRTLAAVRHGSRSPDKYDEPLPFWLEISGSYQLFHSWRDAEIHSFYYFIDAEIVVLEDKNE